MDKKILLVKSEVETTRALVNKDLVSFHKRFELCLNRTVFENCGIYPGMYAKFDNVNFERRHLQIIVKKDRPSTNKSQWYKIRNPQVSKHNQYCYIRTSSLLYQHDLLLLGAFEYFTNKTALCFEQDYAYEDVIVINIKF